MLAGPGSRRVRVERSAVAAQEAAEGTLADQGWMQPGCKASGWEDRQDRLDTERKHGKEFKKKKKKA